MDVITVYYKCSQCQREDSTLALAGVGGSTATEQLVSYLQGGCPHCGGQLEAEPDCYICKHLGVLSVPCEYCQDYSNFEQRVSM
jgi:DNA-directed RNA polymerase subunit RPC12/RpoP